MKLLFIIGSLSHHSVHLELSKEVKSYLESKNHEVSYLDYKYIPYVNQDIFFPAPEYVRRVREEVENSDGVIMFVPSHNDTYPAVIKNLMDWLSLPNIEGDHHIVSNNMKIMAITICENKDTNVLKYLEELCDEIGADVLTTFKTPIHLKVDYEKLQEKINQFLKSIA